MSDARTSARGRRRSGRRNETIVGIGIVAGVLLLFFGVRFLEDRPVFGGVYSLVTELESSGGLVDGSSVRVSGVKVGEVSDITLDPESHRVRIALQIRSGVDIPEGSVASVEGIAALDDVHVSIRTEGRRGPPLADGAVIPGRTEPGLTQRADSTMAEVGQTFEDAQTLLGQTQQDLGVVLGNMQRASGSAASLMETESTRLSATIAALHSAATQLNEVASQLGFVSRTGGDTLVVAMNRLSASMQQLDRAAGSLERSGLEMERFMAAVNAGDGTLGRLAHDSSLYVRIDSAAVRLDSAAARLEALLRDFQEDPGRYLKHLELIDIF